MFDSEFLLPNHKNNSNNPVMGESCDLEQAIKVLEASGSGGASGSTDKVINDLKEFPTYKFGVIYLNKNMFIRDLSDKIFSIGLNINYNRFIKKMYFANL